MAYYLFGGKKLKSQPLPHPELDQEESVLRAFLIELLEASLLLRELVIDLPDVHRLQQGVTVGRVGLTDVDKQVFAILQNENEKTKTSVIQMKANGRDPGYVCSAGGLSKCVRVRK